MTDYLVGEFTLWNTNLLSSVTAVREILDISPCDLEALREKAEEMLIDLDQIERLRPYSKKVPYDFNLALPNISMALRLKPKLDRLLKTESNPDTPTVAPASSSARKIPEIVIIPFSGDVTAYASFIKSFHLKFDNLAITDAERLQHLKGCVHEEPSKVISNLELTDVNYQLALNMLKEKYDNPAMVISELYHKITSLKRAENTPISLRSTYYELEGLLSALTAHGQNVDDIPPLRDQVLCKYPLHITHQVCGTKIPTITMFQKDMAQYIQMRTGVQAAAIASGIQYQSKSTRPKSTTAALIASSANTSSKSSKQLSNGKTVPPVPNCAFCNEKHYSVDCTKVITLTQRREAIKDRCYLCLNRNHQKANCTRNALCSTCGKRNSHHKALCPSLFVNDQLKTDTKTVPTVGTSSTSLVPAATPISATPEIQQKRAVSYAHKSSGAHITVMLTVINPDTLRPYAIRALLDAGSNDSYISERAAKRLGLQLGRFKTVPVGIFAHTEPVPMRTAPTALIIQLENGTRKLIQLDTSPDLPQSFRIFDYNEFREAFPEYVNYRFAPQGADQELELIIGNDYFWEFMLPQQRIHVQEGLQLIGTEFGWTLVGRANPGEADKRTIYFTHKPSHAIDRLCALDAIGVKETPLSVAQEEESALEQFYKNLTFIGDRYEIRWPWREYPPPLPNNYGLAVGRLRSLHRQLTKSSLEQYNQIIETQLRSGIIEEIPAEEVENRDSYYVPHHAVITPEKSTPLRIVYDGSAKPKKNGRSINDCIYKGRNMLTELAGMLLRFRLHNFVTIADIEKAYHQLSVHPEDRNYIRFLWLHDINSPLNSSNIRILRFTRVAFGIVASPFLLNATIQFHLEKRRNEFTDRIKSDIYVDNLCTGVSTLSEARSLYDKTYEIFHECQMELRAWASNDAQIRQSIPEHQRDHSEKISVLGLFWNQYQDTLRVKPFTILTESEITLRKILSSASSFYDPYGLFRPITIRAAVLIQQLRTYEWDTPLPEEVHKRWDTIQNDMQQAVAHEIPRFIADMDDPNNLFELHTYCDASMQAYSCAIYLRTINQSTDASTTHLIFAKSRIVKPQVYTIPKLELFAAVLAVRVIKFIRNVIPLSYRSQILWCDSKCVLNWIKSTKILPVFIQRRIDEIRNLPDISFRYVASADNPADLPTRGTSYDEFVTSIWLTGPSWMNNPQQWPAEQYDFTSEEPDIAADQPMSEEQIKSAFPVTTIMQSTPFNISIERYSAYMKLLRITAYVVQFLRLQLSKSQMAGVILKKEKPPVSAAQHMWIRSEQQYHYADVFQALKNRKSHHLVANLRIFEDEEGLLRCAGRFQYMPNQIQNDSPILLPRTNVSQFSILLVQYFHAITFHAGTAHTLNAIRQEFWLPRGRASVSSIVLRCTQCKRFRARPYKQPTESSLPEFRLKRNAMPFEYVGIDTCGPLYVRGYKRYILLVTDLVIRAVDLELLCNMTTEELSNAFRRIIARRTTPKIILSDNAKQFQLLQSLIGTETSTQPPVWKFIPECSPWMGGAYERLVALTKGALIRTFRGKALSDSSLRTALAEIAGVLNNRPLTYVSEDIDDKPITPNHFLRTSFTLPTDPVPNTTTAVTRKHITSLWKQATEIIEHFWNQWSVSYLSFLREQNQKYHFPAQTTTASPQVNTVVLIAEPPKKRAAWHIGKIVSLNQSRDGSIRSVDLRLATGNIVTRPVSHLYPLEIPEAETNVQPTTPTDPESNADSPSTSAINQDVLSVSDEIVEIECDVQSISPSETNDEIMEIECEVQSISPSETND